MNGTKIKIIAGVIQLLVVIVFLAVGCTAARTLTSTPAPALTPTPTPTPASTPTATPSGAPSISIVQPATNTYVVGTHSVSVMVQVSGFDLVDRIGQPNVPGQGHINYYIDVNAPTSPGQPAVTTPGTYVASAEKSYLWTGVVEGVHSFSVELVNNDNTPLDPPVLANSTVTVYPG